MPSIKNLFASSKAASTKARSSMDSASSISAVSPTYIIAETQTKKQQQRNGLAKDPLEILETGRMPIWMMNSAISAPRW